MNDIIKTMPESVLTQAYGEFANAGTAVAQAAARADTERTRIIQRLLDYATSESIAPKVAVSGIMEKVVLPCTLTKAEQQAGVSPLASGKLAYSTGLAYAKSMEIAMIKGKPFAPGLYAAHLKEAQGLREAAHADKLRKAEETAKDAAIKAKAMASKAARSKSVEAKLAAEAAKVEAAKAQETARKLADMPTTTKTGGKVSAKKAGPAKVLTRFEVAAHAAALVAMLRDIGEESCADDIADILKEHNLLTK